MSATSWSQARIAALNAVSRSNSGRGANPEMMIAQANLLAEWIMETPGAGPSAVGACNPPPAGPVGEVAATADDPTSAPHRSIPRDQYVWAYEKIDCLRVISPYMGDTHDGIDAARRWYADEYADYPDYRGLRLYRLVPVEVDPEPTGTRVCGRCKRTIRPDEPAETALLGTVTDDAKHWTVEMLVCGDCGGDS